MYTYTSMNSCRLAIASSVFTVISGCADPGEPPRHLTPGAGGGGKGDGASGPAGHPTGGGTWQALANPAMFAAAHPLLLSDGTVVVHELSTANWWQLAPDETGSYVTGTWKQLAPMPSGYAPLYYASAVLPDGRLIIEGGEYNGGGQAWTNLGAIYDPVANTWAAVAPPAGWTSIGDASGVVLPDGTFLLSDCMTDRLARLDASTLAWTATGSGKADINDEESWTLLTDGTLLTVDANNTANPELWERFDPATGAWTGGGSTGVVLVDEGSHEIGPAPLRPDGTVFATGGTGHNAVFDTATRTWTAAPDLPDGLTVADGPAAILANGNALVAASPGIFDPGARFFEFDGHALTEVPAVHNATSDSSYQINLLVLPTGQVLATDFSNAIEIYTPLGGPQDAWRPAITSAPTMLARGTTAQLTADRINGLSQGAYYGDDAQSATNFPIVQIKNVASGHVMAARTHGGSTYAIGLAVSGTTRFDVPAAIEPGASKLTVIANGIASTEVDVTIE